MEDGTMRSSSSGKHVGFSGRMFTLHQRLYHALNLGIRCNDDKGQKWYCADIEIQRLVVRAIDAFLDCISRETLQHPLVKDSIADMVGALASVLQYQNKTMLRLASNASIKMISIFPIPIIQYHVLDLTRPLSSLLSSHQSEIAISCAIALSLILFKLSSRKETEVWEILKERKVVPCIVQNLHSFSGKSLPNEYFKEMASLLSRILWLWPPSRLYVWNDTELMETLSFNGQKPDFSMKIAVLQLYSALALCGVGAKKLLENGDTRLQVMLQCMDGSNPPFVQIEAFKFAQCIAISEKGCLEMMKICCMPIVKGIIGGMSHWSMHSGKLGKDQISVVMEACRLAIITRWPGEHHIFFWKLGIVKVLLNLLLRNFERILQYQFTPSLEEQIILAHEGLSANFLLELRPYIWDIFGWLAAHGAEDLNPKIHQNELHIDILITCACLTFVDSLRAAHQISQNDISNSSGSESASRAVLMMIYSPCTYIASQARIVLSEILKSNGEEDLKYLLDNLCTLSFGNRSAVSNSLQTVVKFTSLTCYLGLPQYREFVMKRQGLKILCRFIRLWLSNPVQIKRWSVAPHLHNSLSKRACCHNFSGDWEGEDMLLLFGLWSVAELVHHSGCADLCFSQIDHSELVIEFLKICSGTYAPGPRWYAAYILSYFGIYGFPNELGTRIGKSLDEKPHTDLKLLLRNQKCLNVHGIMVMVRCPLLLPPRELPHDEKTADDAFRERQENVHTQIHLSAHVDYDALLKMLEFVYSGCLKVDRDLVKKLKVLARHCNLHPLLQMLRRKRPKWGIQVPSFDLTLGLGPDGYRFSDVILEAKGNGLVHWTCDVCSLPVPHLHVHKVILCSSCEYLRALFHSGMQESHSLTVKVPVSWDALVKLIIWFYSDQLPKPIFGCLWDNLDDRDKLHEMETYIELCWLAEFWVLEDLHEECSRVVVSCLDSARNLSVNLIQLAAQLSQWRLAEVAAQHMARSYHPLRDSGKLDTLDERLVEMVRAASVRLVQEGGHHST